MFINEELKMARHIIESHNYTIKEEYVLINNYGITFTDGLHNFDARHWINCYGAEVDYYQIHVAQRKDLDPDLEKDIDQLEKELNDLLSLI